MPTHQPLQISDRRAVTLGDYKTGNHINLYENAMRKWETVSTNSCGWRGVTLVHIPLQPSPAQPSQAKSYR